MTRLLHAAASPAALRWLTAGVFGLWSWQVASASVHPLTVLPVSLYEPVGFLSFLPESVASIMLSHAFLLALQLLTAVTTAVAALSRGGAACAVLACAGVTLYEGIVRGFGGHISHHDLVLLYAAYGLALFQLADRVVPAPTRPDATRSGIPLVATIALLCVTYSLTGLFRLLRGGTELFTSGSLTFWALRNSYQYINPIWGLGRYLPELPLVNTLLSLGYPIVTVFEVLAPVCLWSRRFRGVFLAVMIPFHLFSWLFMEIFFWESLLLYVLFLDLPQWRRSALA